jgi:phage tail-like protein
MAAELLTNTRYYWEAEGIDMLQIYQVEGLSSEVAIQGDKTVGSGKGGIGNRQATPAGRETFNKVTLKLYATNEKQLFDWYRACINNEGKGSDWQANRKASSVSVYDQGGDMQARWEMTNSIPQKYELSSLKVDDQQLLLETIIIYHEGIERVQ